MKNRYAILLVLLLLVPMPAVAGTIQPTMGQYYTTVSAHVASPQPLSGTFYIGQMNVTWNNTPYTAYCVDLYTDFYLGSSWSPTERHMAGMPAGRTPYVDMGAGARAAGLLNEHGASISSADQAAALQIAIWESLYSTLNIRNSFDFGPADRTDAILKQANAWYEDAQRRQLTGDAIWLDFNGGPGLVGGQDLMLQNSTPVPEPASMLLFGSGLIGVAGLVRRRWSR